LEIVTGNRLERLLERLAENLERPAGGPFDPEVIVVPTPGMEKWIARELAERFGIWANPSFPFPRNFLDGAVEAVLGAPDPEGKAWSRESMAWSLFGLLGEDAPGETASYLAGDSRGLKRFQLARRLAHTFDQYMVYRPDLLFSWEEGDGEDDWQAGLWRSLLERLGKEHPARRMQSFLEKLAAWRGPLPEGLPSRVSLFGTGTLPPLFVRLFQALSGLLEVRLYLPLPSPALLEEVLREGGVEGGPSGGPGHPLMETMASVSRDFLRVLRREGALEEGRVEKVFDPPGREGLLGVLLADLFRNGPPSRTDGVDPSLEFHFSAGRLREVEVLRERLLALFEEDPSLEPGDVAVLCPDLEAYASLVEAVFGGESGRPGSIPFHLAERTFRGESPLAETFLRLLEVLQGRLTASQAADLLEFPPLAERFGLGPEDLERARAWIGESGIRWGVDGEHRSEEGLPSFQENSWRWGLDRLLLGYAFPGGGRTLFGGILPYDDVEGSAASVLGGLCSFFTEIRRARTALSEPRPPREWASFSADLVDRFFAPGDPGTAADSSSLRALFASLEEECRAAGLEEKVDFQVFREALAFRLGEVRRRHSFLAGGVHFASLLPMRSLPFRVVCLLGMEDGAFPRAETHPPFDKISRDPRPGDRSLREDDRSLFLETLGAARERLLVFWAGRSEREGSLLPPSVVVNELLDVVEEMCPGAGRALVKDHPLQPFSPRYFQAGTKLRGFRGPWLEAAVLVSGPRRERPPFLDGVLEGEEEEEQVSLEDLVAFFKSPARFFFRTALGLYLEERARELEDREPLDFSALEEFFLGEDLVRLGLEGIAPSRALAFFRGAGRIPPGEGGRRVFERIAGRARSFLEKLLEARGGEGREPFLGQVPLAQGMVVGKVGNLFPRGQVLGWLGKDSGKRKVEAWIRHLFFLAAGVEGVEPVTRVLARDRKRKERFLEVVLSGPEDPRKELEGLVELYRLGRRVPLLFFPDQAASYLEETEKGKKGREEILRGLRKDFAGDGDLGRLPEIRLLYEDTFPLDPEFRHFPGDPGPSFEELARRILGPFFRAAGKGGGNG